MSVGIDDVLCDLYESFAYFAVKGFYRERMTSFHGSPEEKLLTAKIAKDSPRSQRKPR
jgi:hypothetical protein